MMIGEALEALEGFFTRRWMWGRIWTAIRRANVPGLVLSLVVMALALSGVGYAGEKVNITAERRFLLDIEKDILTLEGNVRIIQGETTITADRAEVEMAKKVARLFGKIEARGAGFVLYASSMTAYLNERRITFSGNVYVTKGETKAWADSGTYLDREKVVHLLGGVRVERPKGEKLRCQELLVFTDKEAIEAKNGVEVEFEVEEEATLKEEASSTEREKKAN